jgi:uncharacterized delta-60 repeat protein
MNIKPIQFAVLLSAAVNTIGGKPVITVQPQDQTNSLGTTATFSVTATGTPPLSYRWAYGSPPVYIYGESNAILTIANVQKANQGSYEAVITNLQDSTTSLVANLYVTGQLLTQQPPPDSFNAKANDPLPNILYLDPMDVQSDGKILVSANYRNSLVRLNADGTLDASFNAGSTGFAITLVLQADGKILVGSRLDEMWRQTGMYIARLNTDGTPDPGFKTLQGNTFDDVSCLLVQPDGRILVGGNFSTLGGQNRSNIGRLNADGTPDISFNPEANARVTTLAMQADGKILVGGFFSVLGGQDCAWIGRLNPDGTLDTRFNTETAGFIGPANALLVQGDGKILVLGGRLAVLSRLNADGTLDTGFNRPEVGTAGGLSCLALQANGKILVGGSFATLDGQYIRNLGRLNADGTLDPTFNPVPNARVEHLKLQADGKVLVGGGFTKLGDQGRVGIGRLFNTEPATQRLTFDGSTLTWLRGGTSPEVWRTTFESFTFSNGTYLTQLETGTHIPGGWQLTGLALPTNTTFRARGYTVGERGGDSSWFVETIIGPPAIAEPPASLTNSAGTTASFSVVAVGNAPLGYQWRKGLKNLTDGGNVSGASSASLTLSNVLGADAGNYSVVISSPDGTITTGAMLSVMDPAINIQPVGQAPTVGDDITFSVEAVGTPPLSYLWRKDRVALGWATQSYLSLTNFQGADAGIYDVVVSNAWGSATSAPAVLSVNLTGPDSFNPVAFDGAVLDLALQPDGKILVGEHTQAMESSFFSLGRLNTDGTLDPGFNAGVGAPLYPGGIINSLVVQANGKILLGGGFWAGENLISLGLGQLNTDGTLNTNFIATMDGLIDALAVQADGKILVGGAFSLPDGQNISSLGRLNVDGTLDTNFNPGTDGAVYCLAQQADGRIVIGGSFGTLGGQSRTNIGRLNSDGTLDLNFNPGADGGVSAVVVQADGKILVGGGFSKLGGQSVNNFGRLNPDGTPDPSFHPEPDGPVSSVVVQTDGSILVAGAFSMLCGQSHSGLGRLNADGSLDPIFNSGTDGSVYSLALQEDGKILVGGRFSMLGGKSRPNLGRLVNNVPATQSLTFDGSILTWTRGGASPEVWHTTFEVSIDGGTSWINLGAGIRIPGGWQLTGLALPPNATVRARGFLMGGVNDSSSWFVETMWSARLALSINSYSTKSQFGFTVTGPAGASVVVDASTNLINWEPLWTNPIAVPIYFSDPQSPAHPFRYYRAH